MQPAQQQPPAYQQGPPQQQAIVIQQQPMVTVHPGSNAVSAGNTRGSWCWKGLQVTGYMQTILGVLSVVFGIVSIIMKLRLNYIGFPIWCGICFFIVAGILGIAAGGKKDSGLVIGYMVMSILGSVAALVVLIYAAGVITFDSHVCPDNYGSYNYPYNYFSSSCSTSSTARVAIDVCILLIGIAEFVISIIGASFTCCGLYYNSNTTPQTMVTYQSQPQQMVVGGPPQMYIPSGGAVAYPNQVVMQPAQTYQPQGQIQPPPQGQFQPPPQGQFQPPPQGLFQPPPQQQATKPEELDPNKGDNFYQPLTITK